MLLLVSPLALGSWVVLPLSIPLLFVIIARLEAEEKYLAGNLPGYATYCREVRWPETADLVENLSVPRRQSLYNYPCNSM